MNMPPSNHSRIKIEVHLQSCCMLEHVLTAAPESLCSAGPVRDPISLSMLDTFFKFSVVSLHRIPPAWLAKYKVYRVEIGIYFGGNLLAPLSATAASSKTGAGWFPSIGQCSLATVVFTYCAVWPGDWCLTSVKSKHLPRESRVCCSLQASNEEEVCGNSLWSS